MALSKRGAPTANLVAFCTWAKANGYQVGEMPPWGTVHPVHASKSFHYDRDGQYGQAADINWPGGGAPERTALQLAAAVAVSMGLGVLYALNGTKGAAAAHKTHLHADVGSWSSLGHGDVKRTAGDLCVWNLQPVLHAHRDNLWGPDVDRRLLAVRAASNLHGVTFPDGITYTQGVVGTGQDNDWGPLSRRAHDLTVLELERVLKALGYYTGRLDTIWGPLLEKAWATARARYHH